MQVRAVKGDLTGLSPVDRGKPGSKIHAMSERGGIPLSVVISAANRIDHLTFEAVVDAVAPVCAKISYRRAIKPDLPAHSNPN